MGLCSSGGDGGAGQARADAEARKRKIDQGVLQINRIFDGGYIPRRQTTTFDPARTYYTADGQVLNLDTLAADEEQQKQQMLLNKTRRGQRALTPEEKAAADAEALKTQRRMKFEKYVKDNPVYLERGENSKGFGRDFYDAKKTAYVQYALPELAQQSQQQSGQIMSRLGNQGVLHSGLAARLKSLFGTEVQKQKRNIADEGLRQAQELEKNVAQQKATIIGQLQASGDPTVATQQALATASQLQAPSVFSPLGNLFSNFANMYQVGTQGQMYNRALDQERQRQQPLAAPLGGVSRTV